MNASLNISQLSVTLRSPDRSFRLELEGLSLHGGDAVGLTGPSGTGKTLLLELLGLLRAPDPGGTYEIIADGITTALAPLWQTAFGQRTTTGLRGKLFGFVPQSGGLLPFLTVAENIALSQKVSDRVDATWQAHLTDHLGLAGLETLYPAALSMGQRQRVAIARALAHRPLFLIADEPTAALDPETAHEAMGLLVGAAQDQGTALIISSHDIALLDRFPLRRAALGVVPSQSGQTIVSRLKDTWEQAA